MITVKPKFVSVMTFQEAASPIMYGIVNLHHHIFFFLVIVVVVVCYMLASTVYYWTESKEKLYFTQDSTLEVVWTIVPSIILLFIAVPSFTLLYSMDELIDPSITVKVIGHQWYWSYELSDYAEAPIAMDSYMVQEDDLKVGELRLLEVDNSLTLPVHTNIRFVVTAADVLHAWAVPALGIKIDAVPGRLNQVAVYGKLPGTYYGQCSEICGVNHGFMPIMIKMTSYKEYYDWVLTKIQG